MNNDTENDSSNQTTPVSPSPVNDLPGPEITTEIFVEEEQEEAVTDSEEEQEDDATYQPENEEPSSSTEETSTEDDDTEGDGSQFDADDAREDVVHWNLAGTTNYTHHTPIEDHQLIEYNENWLDRAARRSIRLNRRIRTCQRLGIPLPQTMPVVNPHHPAYENAFSEFRDFRRTNSENTIVGQNDGEEYLGLHGILYINLQICENRKHRMEQQLKKLWLDRITCRTWAVNISDHHILGQGLSHLRSLNIAKHNKWDHVLILEDDYEFPTEWMDPKILYPKLNEIVNMCENTDVFMLTYAKNAIVKPVFYGRNGDTFVKIIKSTNASAYIVFAHYYDTLIALLEDAMEMLRATRLHEVYAHDVAWQTLQAVDMWVGYSDKGLVRK